MCTQKKWYTAGPAYLWVLPPRCQLKSDQIYLGKKLSRKFKKTILEFATLCQLFTLHLHCVRHHIWSMDDLKYMGGYIYLYANRIQIYIIIKTWTFMDFDNFGSPRTNECPMSSQGQLYRCALRIKLWIELQKGISVSHKQN